MPHDFDTAALTYDEVFTHSLIGKAQRRRVHAFLSKELGKTPLNILEINCGTGADAHFLAAQGHQVLATDISEGMIDEARKETSKNVEFRTLDINNIATANLDPFYDVLFSNFGGLNCLSPVQLKEFFQQAPSKLEEGGRMILVIMPKNCLWERWYFWLKGNFAAARRRKSSQAVLAHVDGVDVPTWYYNPGDIEAMLSDRMKITKVRPIGCSIPPSYLEPSFKKMPFFMRILEGMEPLFNFRFWSRYSDHYAIALEKL